MKRLKKMPLCSAVVVVSLVLSGCPGTKPRCQDSQAEECPDTPTSLLVKVSAERTSLRVNESTQLSAWGETSDGGSVELGPVTFDTSNKSIAEVDPATGLVTARGTGTATLTATSAKGQGSLTLKVEGGAVHRGTISHSETWYAKDNPHFVLDSVFVEGSSHPVLTIEAGVIVRFTAAMALRIGVDEPGSLKAEGSQDRPIQFVADAQRPTEGFWESIYFGAQSGADSKLAHVNLSHCGSVHPWSRRNPCIVMKGNEAGGGARPVLTDVLITNGAGSGVVAEDDGAFGPGSARVSVKDGGDFPFSFQPNYIHTLPQGGVLEGNTVNAVEVTDGKVVESQTWPDLGVPYVVAFYVDVEGSRSPVLTLPAGLTVRMTADSAFRIGKEQPGGLIAVGTEQKPIIFTAHSDGANSGFWDGLLFYSQALMTSQLSHARVEYAGNANSGGSIVFEKDMGPIVTNTRLSHSGRCGFLCDADELPFITDFTVPKLGNSFEDIQDGNQCNP
ncbi:hypothetical protein F0U61_28990 [Archangium violaceum]|uniref:Ig-like domain-containing protein n=1 Tax=Archangium violaceum TaxID=83451 RepID=UPI002B2DD311|nr:hypothetical protein F0U61_28990 [Archangium violaceum]